MNFAGLESLRDSCREKALAAGCRALYAVGFEKTANETLRNKGLKDITSRLGEIESKAAAAARALMEVPEFQPPPPRNFYE
ncbi:MAG: hypothetical protein WB791_01660 [Waddliaceae bacterium]